MKNNLRKLREAAGFSRRALAEASGSTARSIQAWEYETRDLALASYISIIRLATALGCRPEDLFIEEGTSDELPF